MIKPVINIEAQRDQVSTILDLRKIGGKDMKAYRGLCRFTDSADGHGTVVVAELEINAGRMAPEFLVDRMVQHTGNALKQFVNSMPPTQARPQEKAATPAGKSRRLRHVLRVVKTADSNRIWYAGQTFRTI